MDIDVDPSMPVKTLQKNVDAVLSSESLGASLYVHGVRTIEATSPKQTQTTQRWKAALVTIQGTRFSTRLEFSRRGFSSISEQGTPGAEILREASVPPFAVSFYGDSAMIQQKIIALASPGRNAARDLFDLHHLFFAVHTAVARGSLFLESRVIEKAVEKVGHFDADDFRSQVLPSLPEDLATFYGSSTAFHRLRGQVETRLMEWLG